MGQVEHDNVLPFYGVSTTVSNFCLVFPWYRNGNIMDYLRKNPDVNRFDLVSMFGQTHVSGAYSPTNSCQARPGDYSFYMTIVWFMAL